VKEFELNEDNQKKSNKDQVKDKNYKGYSKSSLKMENHANGTPNECRCY